MIKPCACGCGRMVRRRDNRQQNYIRGHGGHTARVDAVCGTCQVAIKVERWRLDKFEKVFCSRKCSAIKQALRGNQSFVCENCEKSFTLKRSRRQGQHIFCCHKCNVEFRNKQIAPSKVAVHCSNCGQEMMVWPSKAKINKDFYCNKECRANHIIGSNNPAYTSGDGRKVEYGFNWRRQRRKALERDNHTCQHCGKVPKTSRSLHVHHVIPAHTFNGDYEAANQLSNLLTLCMKCHKDAEFGRIAIQAKLL